MLISRLLPWAIDGASVVRWVARGVTRLPWRRLRQRVQQRSTSLAQRFPVILLLLIGHEGKETVRDVIGGAQGTGDWVS